MPLHAIISEETLRRYNTMIVDVFALLEDARRRVLATGAAVGQSRICGSPTSIARRCREERGALEGRDALIPVTAETESNAHDVEKKHDQISGGFRERRLGGRTCQAAAIPEAPRRTSATMQPPMFPSSGPAYQPVVTLNGWTLPWRMKAAGRSFIWSPNRSCARSRPA